VPKSISNPLRLVRAALTLRKVSIPTIAAKHGANYKTCYAVLNGTRPGHDAKVKKAVKEMQTIAQEALS
jgi:hypothetical protein